MQVNTISSSIDLNKNKTVGEDNQLKALSRQFETLFTSYLLNSMSKTVDHKGGLFEDGGMEQEYYTEMLNDEYAKKISQNGKGLGLADMIYKSMVQTYGGDSDKSVNDINQAFNQLRADKAKKNLQYQMGEGGMPAADLYKMYQPETGKNAIERYQSLIQSASESNNIDPNLIKSIMLQESAGNPNAVSAKGAKGLMQLMDSTADTLGVKNSFDPEQNIQGASRYLRQLLDTFNGDESLALAAYNAGPNNVNKYNGIPPFPETVNYVKNVLAAKNQFSQTEAK